MKLRFKDKNYYNENNEKIVINEELFNRGTRLSIPSQESDEDTMMKSSKIKEDPVLRARTLKKGVVRIYSELIASGIVHRSSYLDELSIPDATYYLLLLWEHISLSRDD